ncbi:hypothetical protein ASG49_15565 [Marmoricola sp. Leaf446]|uniref:LppX_LprAFG lipoprotein n=1 Tax=Marmoricola sp. Leaf446 TaxID=1736379 RepID=UPI0006F2E823|nr:LppX_LprAFG lipoprotein [Marmoricola sp. Leaf446]KQT89216.1 hypothetical protein ASG49_15565 [Marmoricola sp. Leaf446]
MPAPTRRLASALSVLVLAATAAGCGGGGDEAADKPTPTEVMQSAKKAFDDAASVRVQLATTSTPTEGNGVLGASGVVTPAPAFEGDVKVLLSGLTATVPVTSVDGTVYAKLPLTTTYAEIDPTEYGAPDPASFGRAEGGLSSLLTDLDGLKEDGQTRDGEQVLTTYAGTLPGDAVKRIVPSADAQADYPTKVGVDDDGRATTVRITGPFFADGADVTYDVDFSDYDREVTVDAPAT